MKLFLIKLGLFLLPIAIFVYSMDYVVTKGLRKSVEGEYIEWNAILQGKINTDILIQGSSTAQTHISPDIIKEKTNCNSYNVGIGAHRFFTQYYRYLTYEKYNKKPKVIIQILAGRSLVKDEMLYNKNQFLPYLEEETIGPPIGTFENGLDKWDFIVPFHRYLGEHRLVMAGIVNSLRSKNPENKSYKGFTPVKNQWTKQRAEAESKKEKREEFKLDSESIKFFDNFLEYTKKENIKLFLVYSPEYVGTQKQVANRDEIINVYKSFAQKHKIPFIDYSNHQISKRFDLFWDPIHLSKKGAEMFTNDLINTLIKDYNLRNCEIIR